MAGENVPLVMLPRYSTFVGELAAGFLTVAMDVSDYESAVLNIWRGRLPTDTSMAITAQESTDQETWTICAGTNCSDFDPGQNAEGQMTATLAKRWFRLKVVLAQDGGYPQVTCWAVGFLEQRRK
jgi:hypothetical protein